MKTKRRKFSDFTEPEAFKELGIKVLHPWTVSYTPRLPSAFYHEKMRRLSSHFALSGTEEAKKLLIDAIWEEAMEGHETLKIWKAAKLETDHLVGYVDYVVAPNYAYLDLPFVCVVEAKKDDFEKGRAQCLVEMKACRLENEREGKQIDVYGVVTNGEGWKFYKYDTHGAVWETLQIAINTIEQILGILSAILSACEQNLVAEQAQPQEG